MKNRSTAQTAMAVIIGLTIAAGGGLPAKKASAQVAVPPPGLFQMPLSQIAVPEPPNLTQFVKNKPAAIRLGKALFWDMQAGSDGVQACASCHFHAGVDNRRKNTMNPGQRGGDNTFFTKGPGDTLVDADWPFHKRDNPDFQASTVLRDSNDIVGSQGVTLGTFVSINTGSAVDNCDKSGLDPVFSAGGVNTRRVTARNTPSVINAVFNFNNFWDGRAHFTFNGVNPFGPLDTSAGIYSNATGSLVKQKIAIELASLASQATGPPLDDTEMSCAGRTFPELGRKMLSLTPLGKQMVHPRDSVLGQLSKAVIEPSGKMSGLPGLFIDPVRRIDATYGQMIKDAFIDTWWNNETEMASIVTRGTPTSFTQMEANFSFFWGLAIQLYEATLVANQTPFDRFLGGDSAALSSSAQTGMNIFFGAGKCDVCHAATELTAASVSSSAFITNIDNALIDQMPVASGQNIIYDNGFNNTAVRRTSDDIGRGGSAPNAPQFINPFTGFPLPLGFCEMAELQANANLPFAGPALPPFVPANFPVANDGAFKTPGLRNVELTGPYFHNGDSLTLEDAIRFYVRGGNFPAANINDLDFNITQIGTMQNDPVKLQAMVDFLKSMTDERVRNESAPFDHPELRIPNGNSDLPVDADGLSVIRARDQDGVPAQAFALTLDPLPARTNRTSLVVSGTKESAATTVEVKVNSGPAIAATAVSNTAWSAQLTGLPPGTNTIAAIGTDPQGTVTLTQSLTITPSDGCFNCAGGVVGIPDVIRALRLAAGLIDPIPEEDRLHGDVSPLVNGVPNPDGRLEITDALLILKKAMGLIAF